jgi:hypothetical protein
MRPVLSSRLHDRVTGGGPASGGPGGLASGDAVREVGG